MIDWLGGDVFLRWINCLKIPSILSRSIDQIVRRSFVELNQIKREKNEYFKTTLLIACSSSYFLLIVIQIHYLSFSSRVFLFLASEIVPNTQNGKKPKKIVVNFNWLANESQFENWSLETTTTVYRYQLCMSSSVKWNSEFNWTLSDKFGSEKKREKKKKNETRRVQLDEPFEIERQCQCRFNRRCKYLIFPLCGKYQFTFILSV